MRAVGGRGWGTGFYDVRNILETEIYNVPMLEMTPLLAETKLFFPFRYFKSRVSIFMEQTVRTRI